MARKSSAAGLRNKTASRAAAKSKSDGDWWEALEILDENQRRYKIKWEGVDDNGNPWEPSWVWQRDVSRGLVVEWERKKIRSDETSPSGARQMSRSSKLRSIPSRTTAPVRVEHLTDAGPSFQGKSYQRQSGDAHPPSTSDPVAELADDGLLEDEPGPQQLTEGEAFHHWGTYEDEHDRRPEGLWKDVEDLEVDGGEGKVDGCDRDAHETNRHAGSEDAEWLPTTDVKIDSDDDEWPEPPKKRRNTKSSRGKKGKGRATDSPKSKKRSVIGRLSRINTIPTDIFLEIASHLHPLDLLTMSRTTKAWRGILTSKSSKPIWLAARKPLGMPDCPSDLSEPQYVRLMFDSTCHVCGHKNVPWMSYALRIRLCQACAKETLWPASKIDQKLDLPGFWGSIDELLDLLQFSLGGPRNAYAWERHYIVSDVIRMSKLMTSKLSLGTRSTQYIAWVDECKAGLSRITDGIPELQAFAQRWQEQKNLVRDEILSRRADKQDKRLKQIEDKFIKMGYLEADIHFDDYGPNAKAAYAARPLTESAWTQIRDSLEEEIQKNNDERTVREEVARMDARKKELVKFHNALGARVTFGKGQAILTLRLADFYNLPSILPLWEKRIDRVTSKDYPARNILIPQIKEFWTGLKQDLRAMLIHSKNEAFPGDVEENVLASIMRQYDSTSYLFSARPRLPFLRPRPEHQPYVDGNGNSPRLLHPTSIFACASCDEALTWPGMLEHSHVNWAQYDWHAPSVALSPFVSDIPWNSNFVYTSPLLLEVARRIAEAGTAAGVDISTSADLTKLKLRCLCCPEQGLRQTPMPWKVFVRHFMEKYHYHRAKLEIQSRPDRSKSTQAGSSSTTIQESSQPSEFDYVHDLRPDEAICAVVKDEEAMQSVIS